MGRTAGFWEQDSAFPDGQIFIGPSDTLVTTGASAITRSGLGLIQMAVAAGTTVTLDMPLNDIILRYGKEDDGQQAFGAAAITGGGQGQNSQATPPGLFATNWQQSGRPPYTIAQNQVVPTNRPKGLTILSATPVFTVAGVALTSVSVGITQTTFAAGVAPVVTSILPAGANSQLTTVTATPRLTNSPINVANQNMIITPFSEIITELTFVTPAGSTVVYYGTFFNVAFNYN